MCQPDFRLKVVGFRRRSVLPTPALAANPHVEVTTRSGGAGRPPAFGIASTIGAGMITDGLVCSHLHLLYTCANNVPSQSSVHCTSFGRIARILQRADERATSMPEFKCFADEDGRNSSAQRKMPTKSAKCARCRASPSKSCKRCPGLPVVLKATTSDRNAEVWPLSAEPEASGSSGLPRGLEALAHLGIELGVESQDPGLEVRRLDEFQGWPELRPGRGRPMPPTIRELPRPSARRSQSPLGFCNCAFAARFCFSL